MNVQFYHKRIIKEFMYETADFTKVKKLLLARGGATFAVEVPKIEFFELAKKNRDSNLVVAYGQAICSSDDNYCKAIGREFAKGRIQDSTFEFAWVELSDGTEKYFLANEKVILTFKKHGTRIYFIEAKG